MDGVNIDERKSKIAAGLLGIFIGSLGVHNFYLGYTKKAIIQISLTVAGLILSIVFYVLATLLAAIYIGFLFLPLAFICSALPFAANVWGIVEGIMILAGGIKVDGKGIPLKG